MGTRVARVGWCVLSGVRSNQSAVCGVCGVCVLRAQAVRKYEWMVTLFLPHLSLLCVGAVQTFAAIDKRFKGALADRRAKHAGLAT